MSTDRVCFIMRGLPGSGKSFEARLLALRFAAVVCSADDFRYDAEGNYIFIAKDNALAHARCYLKFAEAIQAGHNVVVDNTNIRRWEFEKYMDLAKKAGYSVTILAPPTPWAWDVKECARRTVHGVPEDVIARMLQNFQGNTYQDDVKAVAISERS